ncbi:hypothetical protein PoB_001244000 [Plakobranchus ocellatus]|uniref:Uncharacterized protein n=1 Tax=Plakobranchus ocellatus TaxID=259542 RepID=A0AAV3YT21_9GAST|nr:hypothetical protein PoB_001244000 [Plakobranchus ocellatus]
MRTALCSLKALDKNILVAEGSILAEASLCRYWGLIYMPPYHLTGALLAQRIENPPRCSTLERLYPRKTLESTWRPPETLWSLYSGRQIHSGVCLAAAKSTLESVWRPPD